MAGAQVRQSQVSHRVRHSSGVMLLRRGEGGGSRREQEVWMERAAGHHNNNVMQPETRGVAPTPTPTCLLCALSSPHTLVPPA